MLKYLFLTTIYVFTLSSIMAQNNNAFPVQAKVKNGIIEGNYDTHTGIQTYFGVPFAKPPLGDLRWKAPQPLDNWKGVKETKAFSPRPMQNLVFGDMKSRSNGVSEDCLYLNIWTPAKYDTKDLPVLVYFFGGGYVAGDASENRYDGESMAKQGMVVVTVNYRLNIFGFFAHPELSEEASYKASGNYGLLDQQAALQWVHDNIASFGGDPSKVTIAGESAGSISVSYQMASPLSKNLIAGAIGESGAGIHPTLAPIPLAEAELAGAAFAKSIEVPTLKELRALSTREIYEKYNESDRFGFLIVLDGYFLPKTLPEIFEAKEQAQVPLLLGWNSAENSGMAFMQGMPYTKDNFVARVKKVYPKNHEKVQELYPHSTAKEIEWAATNLASDRFIAYSTWKWFDLHRKNSEQPVYRYLYSKSRPPLKDQNLTAGFAGVTMEKDENAPEPIKPIGAPHACEIEYCMGNLNLIDDYAWTEDDYKVSETMQNYFANFIKTGNPNGDNLPQWDAANANDTKPPVMILDIKSEQKAIATDARYLFMDEQYGNDKVNEKRQFGGLALYTLRDAMANDPKGTLKLIAEMGYKYIEAAGYEDGKFYGMTPQIFKQYLNEVGLIPVSSHNSMITLDNADQTIADVKAAGFKYLVIPVPPMGYFKFDRRTRTIGMSDDVEAVAEILNKIGKKCTKANLVLLYHNHNFEFEENKKGIVAMDYFIENTNPKYVNFQLDLYWATYAGVNPVEYFNKAPGRFKSWHVKDMDFQKQFAPVGTGMIDFGQILQHKELSGMEYYFVEQDRTFGQSPIEAIRISHNALKAIGFE